jgi:hypothetical protein
VRPAFYALSPGGWRDYVTLVHPPYTLWHLSYVPIGACLAPTVHGNRLLWTLAAFALAMGVAAHALDELNGRPLETRIPTRALVVLAALSLAGAVAIGVGAALAWTPWLFPFVAAGAFVVVAYNLELFGGRFHGDRWFALDWGAFPLLTAYLAQAERLAAEALIAAAGAALLSLAQRQLSTQVRTVRRRVAQVEGTITFRDGSSSALTPDLLTRGPETALRTLTAAVAALAASLVVFRLVG